MAGPEGSFPLLVPGSANVTWGDAGIEQLGAKCKSEKQAAARAHRRGSI